MGLSGTFMFGILLFLIVEICDEVMKFYRFYVLQYLDIIIFTTYDVNRYNISIP